MYKLKSVKFIAMLLLLGAVFFVWRATNVNAGLAKTKFLGNIIANSVPSNFATYWNQVTPENGGKWGSVQSSPGSTYNWSACDTAYNYARSNNMPFKFHCLVWGSQQPSGVSSASQVQTWINAAGARYASGTQFVDVVNEPLHAVPSYSNIIGGSGSTGWDWIVWSFQQARTAFPNSKLLINEYGIISDPSAASRYVSIINILKGKGLIDGIGIQCHCFNMDTVSTSTMNSVLSTLAATGLPIYVSELDMTGDDQTQLARYREKFPVLWEHPSVQGITLWGYIQGQTWRDQTWLITSSGAERPALQWLKQYFGGTTTATPTVRPTPTPTARPTATPVRTATPVISGPTPVRTPTPVVIPTPTPIPGTGSIKIQFYNQNTAATSNTVYMNFKLLNTGSSAIALSNVKLRYYYTVDGSKTQNFYCDYSPVGSSNVNGTFVTMPAAKTGADTYVEVGFTSGAGSLAAGANTTVQARFAKSDWTNYTQTNDYSFNSSATNFVDWTKVTAYISGSLQWGTEP
jgi:endo-1,4-beta-xylanase